MTFNHAKWGASAMCLTFMLCAQTTSAFAQETAAGNQTSSEAEDAATRDAGPGEIVVTAQRRSERLQDVPIAVSALGGDALQQQGARDIQDIARSVPGLVFTPGAFGKGGSPVIRGVASQVGAATVGLYIDDTPVQVRPGQFSGNPSPQLFDIDRVEVLRGPQGTLFGASSMGGTIRYIMKQPSFSEFSGNVRAEVATQSDGAPNYEVGAAFGGPLSETIAFRASAFHRRDGGYVDRIDRTTGNVAEPGVNSIDTTALRLAVEFRPAEGLRIQPSIFYQKSTRDDLAFFNPALEGIRQDFVTPQTGRDRFVMPSLMTEYEFGRVTLTSVTSYFDRRDAQRSDYSFLIPNLVFVPLSGGAVGEVLPGFENYIAYGDNPVSQKVFTQEVRLASDESGPFRWIVGGFYRHSKEATDQRIVDQTFDPAAQALFGLTANQVLGMIGAPPLLPGDVIFQSDSTTTEKQLAVFGEASYEILPALTLTAGVRISKSELSLEQNNDGPFAGGAVTITGKQKSTPITPKLSLSYKANSDFLLYASAQRGFRVGGVNQAVPSNLCAADIDALGGNAPETTYGSDSLWNYEAGVKSQFADRRITFNAAAYRINWKNIQQNLTLPGCGFAYTDNLGSAQINGVEIEAGARPFEGLSINASVAYTDATFDGDVFSAPNPVTGDPTVLALDGDRLPEVPRWTYSVSAEYRAPLDDMFDFYVRGDHQFVGDRFRTLPAGRAGYTPAVYEAADYNVTNVRAGLSSTDGMEVSLFVTNLFDKRPLIAAATRFSPAVQTVRGTTLAPRTIGVTIGTDF